MEKRKKNSPKEIISPKLLLKKATRRITFALAGFFISPLLMHTSFKNQDHPLFMLVLGIGFITGIVALYWGITGIRYLINFIFESSKEKEEQS